MSKYLFYNDYISNLVGKKSSLFLGFHANDPLFCVMLESGKNRRFHVKNVEHQAAYPELISPTEMNVFGQLTLR